MANDEDYDRAAVKVRKGTANKADHALNNKLVRQSRTFSKRAQNAQDAKKHHDSEVRKGNRKEPEH